MDDNVLKKLHDRETIILDEIVRICENNSLEYFLTEGTLLGAIRHKGFIPWDDDIDVCIPRKDFEEFVKVAKLQLKENFILDYFNTNKKYYLQFAKIRLKDTIMDEKNLKNYNGNKGIYVDVFPLDYMSEEELPKLPKLKKREKTVYKLLVKKNLLLPKDVQRMLSKISIILIKLIPNRLLFYVSRMTIPKSKIEDSKYYINIQSVYSIERETHLIDKFYPIKKVEFEGKMYNAPNDYNYVLTNIYGKNYMELPPEEKRITHNPVRLKFEGEEEISLKQ